MAERYGAFPRERWRQDREPEAQERARGDTEQQNPQRDHAPVDPCVGHRHDRVDAGGHNVLVQRDDRQTIKLDLGFGDVLPMSLLGSFQVRLAFRVLARERICCLRSSAFALAHSLRSRLRVGAQVVLRKAVAVATRR
jgi:hypothetical protein